MTNADGSLTIYLRAVPPPEDPRGNWLPAPKSGAFSLFFRPYWRRTPVTDGLWAPLAVQKASRRCATGAAGMAGSLHGRRAAARG